MAIRTISNKTDLAEWLGVSRNTLYKWMRDPTFPVEPNGEYSPYKIGQWQVKRGLSGDDSGEEEKKDFSYWQTKKLEEEVRSKQRQNDEAEARLVDVAVVESGFRAISEVFRSAVEIMEKSDPMACDPFRSAVDRMLAKLDRGGLDLSE